MVKVLRATPERRWSRRALLLVLTLITVFGSLGVRADARDQAKRLHDRIAGVPPDAATLNAMEADIVGGNPVNAAPAAQVTYYQLPQGAFPHDVSPGANGTVWLMILK